MIDKPNNLGIVAAGLAAGVLIALCVHAYHRPALHPAYRWLRVETIWTQNWAWRRTRVGPYYAERATCERSLGVNGLETLGSHTYRRAFNCVRIHRGTP